MLVSQVMTTDVISASPDQSLKHAAQIMEIKDFDALPVCTNFRLVGMISIRDIVVIAVENGLSLEETKISEIMSGEARYVFEDQETEYVLNFMNEHQLSRLLVLNRENHLIGIVSVNDILQADSNSSFPHNQNQITVSRQIWPDIIKRPSKHKNSFDLITSKNKVSTYHSPGSKSLRYFSN
jgi:CBS domain-containing protein